MYCYIQFNDFFTRICSSSLSLTSCIYYDTTPSLFTPCSFYCYPRHYPMLIPAILYYTLYIIQAHNNFRQRGVYHYLHGNVISIMHEFPNDMSFAWDLQYILSQNINHWEIYIVWNTFLVYLYKSPKFSSTKIEHNTV